MDNHKLANENQNQANYKQLASLWYEIKQRGLECDDFMNPQFTTLFRQEESLTKYRQYHVYALTCWEYAKGCYLKGFHDDVGFAGSIIAIRELHCAWLLVSENRRMFGWNFVNWVDSQAFQPKVELRGENAAQGKGVFSSTEFKKGDFIGFFEGQFVQRRTKMTLQFAPDFQIEPEENSPFRYLNHSCNANSYFVGRNLYAWRDIRAGEEITIDYNCHEPELASPFQCNCGTTGCVREIRGYYHLTQAQKKHRQGKECSWLAQSTKEHEEKHPTSRLTEPRIRMACQKYLL